LPSPAIPEDEVVIPLPAIPDEAILPVFFEGLEAAAPPPDTSTVAAPIPTAEPPLPTPVPSPTAASPKPFKKPQEPSTDKVHDLLSMHYSCFCYCFPAAAAVHAQLSCAVTVSAIAVC